LLLNINHVLHNAPSLVVSSQKSLKDHESHVFREQTFSFPNRIYVTFAELPGEDSRLLEFSKSILTLFGLCAPLQVLLNTETQDSMLFPVEGV